MTSEIRIFGGALGEPRGFIDCDITGISLDGGSITLQEQGTSTTWAIEPERLAELHQDNLVYDLSAVDDTKPVWNTISDVEEGFTASPESDKSHYVESARELFRGAQ